MTNKEIVIDLLEKLPEKASLRDIAKEIEFVAGIREGFEQIDRGEGTEASEVKKIVAVSRFWHGSMSLDVEDV